MNRFLKTSIACGLAASSILAVAAAPVMASDAAGHGTFSGDNRGPDSYPDSNQVTTVSGTPVIHVAGDRAGDKVVNRAIRHWKGGRFDVENIAELASGDASPINDRATEHGYINRLHRAIESNKALSGKLVAQNIELSNVIGADTAADGSLTIYTR